MLFYIWALIFIFLEVSLFKGLSFLWIKPNLMLLLLTTYCFYFNFNKIKVILFSLFCGFLVDAFSIDRFGTYMLIFAMLGILLSFVSNKFLRYNWIFIIPLFIFATITEGIIYVLVESIFFSRSYSMLEVFWRVSIPELLYGLLIFYIFFKLIKKCVIDKLS